MNRREFLRAGAGLLSAARFSRAQAPRPNVIVILADDLGYGDLHCYGSNLSTPNLDRMAEEGVRFESFYSASSVCSPARAALLTGRYPVRTGVTRVLFPNDDCGLPESEATIGNVLGSAGYRTMAVGKWHLGSKPEYLPTRRGFDEFFGLPYSNDMNPLCLMRNAEIVQESPRPEELTRQYTEAAIDFVARQDSRPFFLYLGHTYPHIPLGPSQRFQGTSKLGMYGDAVSEMDWSCGEILQSLKDNGLDENTLVIFTSDNGPWYQGSPGRLRGRKGETFEGGMREPMIARFPGQISGNRNIGAMATTLDLLPTLARLCGASLPEARLDGVDIWPLLTGERNTLERDPFLFFDGDNVQCVRRWNYKLHVARCSSPPWLPELKKGRLNLPLSHPELYDVDADPSESYDIAGERPEIVELLLSQIGRLMTTFPTDVQNTWRNTMGLRVVDTPAGSWPVGAFE